MNKHFHLKISMFSHLCNLADAQFSRRHDTGHSIRFPLVCPVCRNNRHLGTRMNIQIRKCLMNKLHHPDILHDHRIQSIVIKRQKKIIQILSQFFVCQKCIDRKIYFLVTDMGKIKDITQLLHRRIICKCSRRKPLCPCINCICPMQHGSINPIYRAARCQYFYTHRSLHSETFIERQTRNKCLRCFPSISLFLSFSSAVSRFQIRNTAFCRF